MPLLNYLAWMETIANHSMSSRLWNNRHDPKSVEKSLDDSLKALDVDYVDLYLMHWPSPFKDGENKFPKDENEKIIPGDADYVDT